MQQPNDCFFCGRICDRTICKRCVKAMDAADTLTRKEMGLIAAAFKVITAPVAIEPGIDQRAARFKNPGSYDQCACGAVKGRAAKLCRKCRNEAKCHPCPEILATGLRCGNRAILGRERCNRCAKHWSLYHGPRGGGVSLGPRIAPDPARLAEAKACAAALMASLRARLGVEVRL